MSDKSDYLKAVEIIKESVPYYLKKIEADLPKQSEHVTERGAATNYVENFLKWLEADASIYNRPDCRCEKCVCGVKYRAVSYHSNGEVWEGVSEL